MNNIGQKPATDHLEILFYIVKKKGMNPTIFKSPLNELENPKTQIKGVFTKKDFMNIISELFSEGVCQNSVAADFIEEEDFQTKNHLFMVLLDKRYPTNYKGLSIGKPVGFLVGRTFHQDFYGNPTTECYLDLVCSQSGTGHYLIEYFIRYSETNGYDAVSLSSLDNVITYYYSKYGFENRHSCVVSDEPVFVPTAELVELMKGDYRGKTSLADKPELFKYLETIRRARFGKKDENCDGGIKPVLTPEDYARYRCGSEGWMMRRCRSRHMPIKIELKEQLRKKPNKSKK